MTERVPIRLVVHFQQTPQPLLQVTDGRPLAGGGFVGAGTRVLDLSDPQREFQLDTGETFTAAHALGVLRALANLEGN